MKTERHVTALLKFLKMFTAFLVRLGLCSLTCFIFSHLILTGEIGLSCCTIILVFSPCYYRYCNKHQHLQRNGAGAFCLMGLRKHRRSSVQRTQGSLPWLLLWGGGWSELGWTMQWISHRQCAHLWALQLWFGEIWLLFSAEEWLSWSHRSCSSVSPRG